MSGLERALSLCFLRQEPLGWPTSGSEVVLEIGFSRTWWGLTALRIVSGLWMSAFISGCYISREDEDNLRECRG